MSSSNCCFLNCIQVSQDSGQVVWYSHLFHNFPQFIMIHTVKGFDIVNKTEIDVFLDLSCFVDDPGDVGNLISGSSAFSKTSLNIWKFTVHVLLKPGLENFEHYFTSVWDECNCAVVWVGVKWPFTCRRQQEVSFREQSGIHKKLWPLIIWKGITPPCSLRNAQIPGWRELLKAHSQRSVVCTQELQAGYMEASVLLRNSLERKCHLWRKVSSLGILHSQRAWTPDDTVPGKWNCFPFSPILFFFWHWSGEVRNGPWKWGRYFGRKEAANKATFPTSGSEAWSRSELKKQRRFSALNKFGIVQLPSTKLKLQD